MALVLKSIKERGIKGFSKLLSDRGIKREDVQSIQLVGSQYECLYWGTPDEPKKPTPKKSTDKPELASKVSTAKQNELNYK